MENSERIRVRKYRKSSVPRLRWTPELHQHFVESVQKLGGKYKATPKKIWQMMGVRGLKISHIKSHLQMHRSMKGSNGSNTISLYQENNSDCINLLPLRKPCQRRRNVKQNGETLFYHQYQGRNGSTSSAILNGDGAEISKANIENFPQGNAFNFWESISHCPINLDLTISSHYFIH